MGNKKHAVNLIFTVTLLGVFALSAIMVAVMGAQVYQRGAAKMQANFDTRTSLVYISEKLRQNPDEAFRRESVEGSDALVLTQSYDGNVYESWIYVHDGKLYEVMVAAGTSVKPGDGQRIMSLNSIDIDIEDTLLTITVVDTRSNESSLSIGKRV
jgi:hypothetical protein